ncbi:glucose 1-dehydrogenase [Lusitaniella coriacea LEGE 07157]|uniref:Glucose 1-dehydrogenase n=1 Tax=Lusitaniella coriacea LEGE 07157 TaxID=945747 RepID=A0A8J7ARV7_9CYAN|nr:glucose 1-dehydrogenase [Lusitaniella coriacea]MBE9115076.1 glucose 1-dehydrogenase [Lusitaniella coriacea LEGE 07157]
MARLAGKAAVITGGNSGIGLETAKAFIREGARVIIFGRDRATLDKAVEELGEGAISVQGDVINEQDLERLFETAKEQFGGLDILFVNAGIAPAQPIETITEEFFDRIFDINVKGAFFTVQRALPLLRQGASVIFTTSIASTLGMPGMSAYSASKAAVRSLTRTLAAELVERGIRVNAISPGPIETPIHERSDLPSEVVEEIGQTIIQQVPAGRFGSAQEIAEPVVFLASDESSYMLGAELIIDGGMGQI